MANDDARVGAESVWSCRFCGSAVESTPSERNLAVPESCVADLFARLSSAGREDERPVRRAGAKKSPGRS